MTTKKLLVFLVLVGTALSSLAAPLEWFTDLQAAQDKARRENKFVLLDFTGSDWCGWCIKLKHEVFDRPEFAAFANVNLEMVEVDFPRHKPQSPAQQQANERLERMYRVDGYPTVILLNANGQLVGRTGYMEGGPQAFTADLERIPGMKHVNMAAVVAESEPQPEPPRKPVTFVPIAPAVATRYNALALKAISGAKDRRMAMINNQTFMAGETAKVKVLDQRIDVLCKEIREDSVLIVVDGKSQELKLNTH